MGMITVNVIFRYVVRLYLTIILFEFTTAIFSKSYETTPGSSLHSLSLPCYLLKKRLRSCSSCLLTTTVHPTSSRHTFNSLLPLVKSMTHGTASLLSLLNVTMKGKRQPLPHQPSAPCLEVLCFMSLTLNKIQPV